MIDLAGFHQHELVLPRKLAARPSKKVVGRLFSIVSFFLKRFSFLGGILGGGSKNCLFSSLFGEMIQFDFFSNGLKPPTRIHFVHFQG